MFGDGAEPLAPDLGTAKAVATSTVVLAPAARKLQITVASLREGLSVTVPADTNMLVISDKAATPATAFARARVVSLSVCAYQNAAIVTVAGQQAKAVSGGARSSVLAVETATLVSPAELPKSPSGHSLPLDLVVGLIAGLGLGVGVASLVDRYSKKVADQADLEDQLGKPVLAVIPRPRETFKQPARRRKALSLRPDPLGSLGQSARDANLMAAYRALRIRLQDLSAGKTGQVIVVSRLYQSISPEPRTAVGLAVSFALAGHRVVLVGADLNGTAIATLFGLTGTEGLSDQLSRATPEVPLVGSTLENLMLLTEGCVGERALDRYEKARLAGLLGRIARWHADVVVVDGPPLLDAPEALAVVASANAVVLDVDYRHTARSDLNLALAALGSHQDRLVGVALTREGSRRSRATARRSRQASGQAAQLELDRPPSEPSRLQDRETVKPPTLTHPPEDELSRNGGGNWSLAHKGGPGDTHRSGARQEATSDGNRGAAFLSKQLGRDPGQASSEL
jgi:Mrp family chromosome partitioning ATPase/capsular polysaccharide biosynthesis protein